MVTLEKSTLQKKITKSSIDHIIARTSNLFFIGGIIKQKVADHYFAALRILKENCTQQMEESQYKQIIGNKKVDYSIKRYNWNSLLHLEHIALYQAEKLGSIYES